MRNYDRTHRPSGQRLAPEDEVLAAVRRCLTEHPHRMVRGGGMIILPGPNVTDIARACNRYAEAVRPALAALVERGVLATTLCGSSRCYTLPPAPAMERSA
jgi:hypothetical protein